MGATDVVPVQGLFDKIHNLSDILNLLRTGVIADGLAIVRDLKNRDLNALETDGPKILIDLGFTTDAEGARLIIEDLKNSDYLKLLTDVAAEVQTLIADFSKAPPSPIADGSLIRVGAAAPDAAALTVGGTPMNVKTMTRAQSQLWFQENRAQIRQGAKNVFGHFLLRRVPEIRDALAADTPAEAMTHVQAIDPATLDKIINIMRVVANVCALAGAMYPPLLLIASVLKLIIAYYDANHPTAAGVEAFDGPDHGLALEDIGA